MAYGAVWAARQVAKEACRTTFRRFLMDDVKSSKSRNLIPVFFSRNTSHFPSPTSRVGEPAEEAIWVRRGGTGAATVSVRGTICGRNGPAANLRGPSW